LRNENMTADIDPIEAGTITAGVQFPFSSRLRQIEVQVTYHPRTDTVAFQFPYQTVTYRQYWNTANREALLAAISRYQTDFAAKSLPHLNRGKMRRAYGALESVTEWGSFKFMVTSRSYPKVDLGYTFEKNSPYFTITQRPAPNKLATADDARTNSLRITLFFTRALAETLAATLDRSRLLSLLPTHTTGALPTEMPPDDY
jgi:hypothetical protein